MADTFPDPAPPVRAQRPDRLNRLHARLAGIGPVPSGFTAPPEPASIGRVARGRQMSTGSFLFRGYLIEAPETPIWDLPMPDPEFEAELHGFGWLEDLAAAADPVSQALARDWTHDWIARFGTGAGPGWTPDLAGRRILRWIDHSEMLLEGAGKPRRRAFFRTLARQTRYLARRWRTAPPGLARIEALAGLVHAGGSLRKMGRHAAAGLKALAGECADRIDPGGAIASRNPEELAEIFALLARIGATPGGGDHPRIAVAVAAMASALRTLRHADGGLPRFHARGAGS